MKLCNRLFPTIWLQREREASKVEPKPNRKNQDKLDWIESEANRKAKEKEKNGKVANDGIVCDYVIIWFDLYLMDKVAGRYRIEQEMDLKHAMNVFTFQANK